MPYRFDARTKLNTEVELRRDGLSLGRFLTRDIDSTGVFIEAACGGLQVQDAIEIDFLFDRHARYTQPGTVVRCTGEGIAVMFVAENVALFEALSEQLVDRYPPAYTPLVS